MNDDEEAAFQILICHVTKTYRSLGYTENDAAVLLVSPFFKGMLLQVGSAEAPNKEMRLHGSLFLHLAVSRMLKSMSTC